MRYCTNCGHQLGIGRYCTNCGARVPVPPAEAPPTEEEYPTSVRPVAIPPPPLGPEPTSARYPLFADTVPAPAAAPATSAPPRASPLPVSPPTIVQPPRRRRSGVLWIVVLAVLALVAVTGVLMVVLGGPGDGGDAAQDHPDGSSAAPVKDHSAGPGSSTPDAPRGVLVPVDVKVPGTAPASVDSDGVRVTFVSDNMLDEDPRTSWRVAGDAAGSDITFTFDHPVTLTEVGLVNGYAKTDPPHNWYDGNRRITDVTWSFDDGTEVAQTLEETQSLQTVDVAPVTTTRVVLHLDGVTSPGAGPDARDYTAISEVAFSGS